MIIQRTLTSSVKEYLQHFPVTVITGPRQSGKTTLARSIFGSEIPYFNLEDPDIRLFAEQDPRGFLATCGNQAILDEIQRVPHIFSFLQSHVDDNPTFRFLLTGSHNFDLMASVTQSLAGRAGLLTLLPLSYQELEYTDKTPQDLDSACWMGGYPRIFSQDMPPKFLFPNYVHTYIERDVRQIKNIGDISSFLRFVKLCAGRAGQLLNLSSLAHDCGIAVNTAKAWLSVLEAGYIVYLLKPHHKNFSKRLIKMPKLYFYDTGILCYLLEIDSPNQLQNHYAKGAITENFIINELLKAYYHRGVHHPPLFFWRDHRGLEIDCIIEHKATLRAIEIKSGATIADSFFSSLHSWQKLSESPAEECFVLYGGNQSQKRSTVSVLGWKNTLEAIADIVAVS
jgi:predicted AAA+ superfamily ATPase